MLRYYTEHPLAYRFPEFQISDVPHVQLEIQVYTMPIRTCKHALGEVPD
jgi:hypothetical protein